MRRRAGFTIIELLIVLTLVGIIGGIALVSVSNTLAQTHVQRAASVIAMDLKLAHSLAARARRPVKISVDTAGMVIRVVDYATWTTVYSERHFGPEGDYPVQFMAASDTTLLVFPNGLASGGIDVTVRAVDHKRKVSMTRAGQVRVSVP